MRTYTVTMQTTVTLTVPIVAESREAAEDAAMGDALPRYPVGVVLDVGCPEGADVSLANKAWEVVDEDEDEED